MKKVILVDDKFPNNELYVHLDIDKETRICFEVTSGTDNTILRVNLDIQDAKTLRDTIMMCVIQMERKGANYGWTER